jgi:hypothetical protein
LLLLLGKLTSAWACPHVVPLCGKTICNSFLEMEMRKLQFLSCLLHCYWIFGL